MKIEAKNLFYIGKQLISNNLPQILDALQKSRQFLLSSPNPQHINTLLISLLDLFSSTKISYIRVQISKLIPLAQGVLEKLPSRVEIVGILVGMLRAGDPGVRVLGLEIVGGLWRGFGRDGSVYHFLLGRLGTNGSGKVKREELSEKEFVKTVLCLRALLENSQYLAKIFSNNLQQLHKIGGIHLRILCYLAVYAFFEYKSYEKIIETIYRLYCSKNGEQEKDRGKSMDKVCKRYLRKMIVKGCEVNYRCVRLYEKNQRIRISFPQLQAKINKIKAMKYNFLSTNPSEMQSQRTLSIFPPKSIDLTKSDYLDLCYSYFSLSLPIPSTLSTKILSIIQSDLQNDTATFQTLLLTYYCTPEIRRKHGFDEQIAEKMDKNIFSSGYIKQDEVVRLLKMALVCRNWGLASRMLEKLSQLGVGADGKYMGVMMMFGVYVGLHSEPSIANLVVFLTVLQNFAIAGGHQNLLKLAKRWQQIHASSTNLQSSAFSQEQFELIQIAKQYKNTSLDQGQQIQQVKIQCKEQLQQIQKNSLQILLTDNPYLGIYFSKCTILNLWKFL